MMDRPTPPTLFSLGTKMAFLAMGLAALSVGICVAFTWALAAWYSPLAALQTWISDDRYLLQLLFCGALVIFAIGLFVLYERLLSRPFQHLIETIDAATVNGKLIPLPIRRYDEWGLMADRLNQFLAHLLHREERGRLLLQSSLLLGAPPALSGSLDAIFSSVLHRNGLSACLLLTEKTHGLLKVDFSSGLSQELSDGVEVRLGEGIAGVAAASASLRLAENISDQEHDPFLRTLSDRLQARAVLILPLKVEGRCTGLAVYVSRSPQAFPASVLELLSELSDTVALALYNTWRVADLEARNRRLESETATTTGELAQVNRRLVHKVRELKTVYDLALATAASTSVEDIVRVVIGGIKELVEVSGGAFFRFDKESGLLEPFTPAFDLPASGTPALSFKIGESRFIQQVLQNRQPQILNFVDRAEQLPPSWKAIPIRSILALPLQQGSDVTGVFCVINKLNGLFSDDDVRLLTLLTSRVNEVLRRLALDQQLHQRVHDLSVLQEIASQLPSPPVLGDTVRMIGQIVRHSLSGSQLCFFFVHHVESEALVMVGGDWDPALTFDVRALTMGPSEKVPLATVFSENQPAYYRKGSSTASWEKDQLIQAFQLNELLYLPLSVEQGHIGVLAIGCGGTDSLSLDHRRLAGLIAKQVAVVIERSRLYERLRSANEKLQQINHLKNEFISMVSHELRTPLTTIKGFVSIVLNEETGSLNAQQRHFLQTSDRAIDRLTLLVSDLLDISRIEAGQIKMQMRPVSILDLINRVVTSFTPQVKAQNLSLTVKVPVSMPKVMADPDRLAQVFDNLLTNALKFTSTGGITLSATDKGDFVMVSVRDTGSGIPKEEQDRIFEKFYQVKVGNAWPSKGTGLGLAIVRSIIESHRGKVWVESESGQGADFRFLLPRARKETVGEVTASPMGRPS